MITKMNIKKSLLIFAGLLTIVFLAGIVSADIKFVPTSVSQTITSGQTSVVVNFQLNNTGATNYSSLNWSATSSQGNWTVLPTVTALNVGEILSLTATLSNILPTFDGTINANIHVNDGVSPAEDLPVTIVVQSPTQAWENNFCLFDDGEGSNPGELDVKIKDVNAVGFGDGNEVLPFDTLEIEVSVDNQGSDNIDNIEVEWGLYDSDTGDWVIDVDNEKDFDLKDGNDETITFSFDINDNMDVDLSDLDESDNYVLYVRATGDVDNNNNDITCESDTEDIQLIIEKDFVVAKDITAPETVSCNSDLQVSADIWNIGTRNQDNVVVKIFNKDLSINKLVEVGDIDSFDNTNLDETFKIPSNAKEQSYSISFEIYDDGATIYVNDYDDQEARFTKAIKVTSCSGITDDGAGEEGNILVSAEIQDGGEAGKPLIIKAVVTNTGDSSATLLLNAAGYSSWAESVNVVPESITLAAGKSASALLTFEVNKDASGDNLFDLEIVSGNNLVAVQPVSVSITEGSSGFSLGGSWYLWLIVALNVILVIVIIAIAVKVSKKK